MPRALLPPPPTHPPTNTNNTAGGRGLARPRRWYVAIYNSNASRLSEPVRVRLWVQYRDLTRQPVACPFDCYGRGRCVDPLSPLQTMQGSLPQGLPRLTADPKTPGGLPGPGGSNPELASRMALGPLQDLSPVDAGFMCTCGQGFGGLLCEGRVQNLTIGSGEQRAGPELLEPGAWFYYIVTIDSKFNPNSDDLGIQWIVGQPSSPPSNYTNAYISFDQGPLHRWVGGWVGGCEEGGESFWGVCGVWGLPFSLRVKFQGDMASSMSGRGCVLAWVEDGSCCWRWWCLGEGERGWEGARDWCCIALHH